MKFATEVVKLAAGRSFIAIVRRRKPAPFSDAALKEIIRERKPLLVGRRACTPVSCLLIHSLDHSRYYHSAPSEQCVSREKYCARPLAKGRALNRFVNSKKLFPRLRFPVTGDKRHPTTRADVAIDLPPTPRSASDVPPSFRHPDIIK